MTMRWAWPLSIKRAKGSKLFALSLLTRIPCCCCLLCTGILLKSFDIAQLDWGQCTGILLKELGLEDIFGSLEFFLTVSQIFPSSCCWPWFFTWAGVCNLPAWLQCTGKILHCPVVHYRIVLCDHAGNSRIATPKQPEWTFFVNNTKSKMPSDHAF